MDDCTAVRHWLSDQTERPIGPARLAALCTHIQGCQDCEQHLQTHVAARLTIPIEAVQAGCSEVRADLAAYIDIERDAGVEMARTVFPHVWWHLLVCDDCVAIADSIQVLVQA